MTASYSFTTELWLYPGEAGWHFLTVPADIAEEIRERSARASKAFGSIKVGAEIAGHAWETSLFGDTKTSSHLLPVKKTVRTAAKIGRGDNVAVTVTLLEEPG